MIGNKKDLRTKYLKIRSMLSKKYIQEANSVLTKKVIWFINRYQLKKIGIYIASNNEVETREIIKFALKNNVEVFVPLPNEKTLTMKFKQITNLVEDLELNQKLKVYQPKKSCPTIKDINDLDAIFIPVVTFDRKLTRIGIGLGYYDRWINQSGYLGYKIGLSQYSQMTSKTISKEESDVRLDFCITEKEVYLPIINEDEERTMDFDITYWRLNDE